VNLFSCLLIIAQAANFVVSKHYSEQVLARNV